MAGETVTNFVNGEETEVEATWTLLDVVEIHLQRDRRTVAVEYNGEIVPRRAYGDCRIAAGDRLEVVHFVQGG